MAAEEVGLGINKDVNSGNPIGMGMGASCLYKGARTTATAYLKDAPQNLTVVTDAPGAKVLMDGKKAIGVKTIDGRKYYAKKEVVLSAGVRIFTLNTRIPANNPRPLTHPNFSCSPASDQPTS